MKKSTRQAYGEHLNELFKSYPKMVVLDADLSGSTKTSVFKKEHPERHFNLGIAEANLMGVAAGLAAGGQMPWASTFAVFGTGRAFEIIRNSICYPNLNVKLALSHAGISAGEDGGSHQSVEDVSIMRTLPNMTVLVPADATETCRMMEAAMKIDGPVYIRLGRMDLEVLFDEDYEFNVGEGVELKTGRDVTIIAMGLMVEQALKAAERLKDEGISAEVINMGSVKPIDADLIVESAAKTGAVVTAEEHSVIGGLGSAVCEVLSERFPVPVVRVGLQDTFGQSGKAQDLLEHYGMNAQSIVAAAKKAISQKD